MGWIHKKLWIFFLFSSGSLWPIIRTKFTNYCEFDPVQVKLYVFSHMSFLVFFRVKLVANNMALCAFLQKHTNVPNQPVRLQYFFLFNSVLVWFLLKVNSFCLMNWVFPFVGPQGSISCSRPEVFLKIHRKSLKRDSNTGAFQWTLQHF